MSQHRSGMFQSGSRWLSEGELQRLRREATEDPEAARRLRRLEHRAGEVEYRSGWRPSKTSWTEYDSKKTFEAIRSIINWHVDRWRDPYRAHLRHATPNEARYYYMMLKGTQNVSGSADLPGYGRNNERARQRLFKILRGNGFIVETRPGQPRALKTNFPGDIWMKPKGEERILVIRSPR